MSQNTPGVGRSSISNRIKQFESLNQTNEVQPQTRTTSKSKVESGSPPQTSTQVQEPPKPMVQQEGTFSQISKETVDQKQSGGGSLEQVSQQQSQRPIERSKSRKLPTVPPRKTETSRTQNTDQSTPPPKTRTPPKRTSVKSTPPPPQQTTTQSTPPQTNVQSSPPPPQQTTTKPTPPPRTKTPPPQTNVQSTPPPPQQTTTQPTQPPKTQTPPPPQQTNVQSTPPPPQQTNVQSTPPPPQQTTIQSTPPPPQQTTIQSTPPPPQQTTIQSTPPPQQGTGGVGGVSTSTTLGSTDTGTLFNELKSEFPHLRAHFESLAQQGVKVEVVRTDPSAGSGAYFNQETNAIRVQDNGSLSRPALKDNVLYESFNAVAEKQYKVLDKDLSIRKLSLSEYGDKKARAEGQVTINYVDAVLEGFKGGSKTEARNKLVELSKQVPVDLKAPGAREIQDRLNLQAAPLGLTEKALRATAWAERLAPGYLANPQPSEHKKLQDDFVGAPHKQDVPSTHRFSLSSANLYTYEGLERQTAGGLIGLLQAPLKGQSSDQVTRIRNQISALRPALERLDSMPETTESEKNAKANAKCSAYENALQTLIREHPTFATKFQPIALPQGIKTFAGI